jgi:hypothetical protein
MEVRTGPEAQGDAPRTKGKRQSADAAQVAPPAVVAEQTGRLLTERESQWLERLVADPASFAAVEREVHDQARRQADRYVAGLLAKASQRPETTAHVARVIAAAEVPLRAVEKKDGR